MIEMPLTNAAHRIRRIALGDLVYRTAKRFGERTALVDGAQRIRYDELDRRSSRLAHHLQKAVGAGQQVGMLCANSIDMVVATHAIHKAGQVWVPVNIKLDTSAIAYILEHAEVSAIVADEALCAQSELAKVFDALKVPVLVAMAERAESIHGMTLAQAEAGQPHALPEVDIDGQQPALLMYTSGTTGHPKGVVHSHLSVYSAVMGNMVDFRYTERDVLSGWLPLFHCAQHTLAATACAAGACVVLSRTFVPPEIAQLVVSEGMTVFVGLPMMYAAVLADPAFRPTSLRQCVYAMAPIPKTLIPQIAERMCPNIMLATGQTEIYPATMTFLPMAHPGRDANYWGTSMVTCETGVMDDEGHLLGAGEVGEIVHRGPNVMMGYFKDPEATAAAQRFGWHHTGDLGMWDDGGQMLFLDRKKDMIKTGGENVASVKVESVLLAHPAVAGAAVMGVPHERWGEAVCAVVVRKPGTEADEASVLAHCKERLGGFEVPKIVHFVEALPATATGKVQKHVLRKTLSEQLQAKAGG